MKVLCDSYGSLGARVIARTLKRYGIELGEWVGRYYLKVMDEKGLTWPLSRRDSREITPLGIEGLYNALVTDKLELPDFRGIQGIR